MAQFDFDALKLVDQIEEERDQATKAQKDFALTVQREGDAQLKSLTSFNQDVADLASQQSAVSESIMEDLREADRIQGSIPLSLLSETLETIAPHMTVKGRMQSAARKREESKMLRDQFELKAKQQEIEEQKRLQRIKNAQAAMDAESGDVAALQAKFANLRALAQDRRAASAEARAQYTQQINERADMLETADETKLDALVGKQGITKQMVAEEKLRRQAKIDAAHLTKQAIALNDRKMELLARQKEGEGFSVRELTDMQQRCEDKGFVVSPDGNTFQCSDLAVLLESKTQFRDAMIEANVAIDAGLERMSGTMKAFGRAQGVVQDPAVSGEAYLSVLAKDETLDPTTRSTLAAANARIEQAKKMQGSFLDKAAQIDKAIADADQAWQAYQKQRIVTAAKPHAPAMTEYWNTGQVDSIDNAISSSVFALQTADSTGNEIYDSGLAEIPRLTQEAANAGGDMGKKVNAMLTEGKTAEAYAAFLATDSGRQQVANTMWQIGAFSLYKMAALGIEDERFSNLMHDETSSFYNDRSAGPEFSMQRMFSYLRQTEQTQKFTDRVNEIIDKYAMSNYSPQGRKGHVIASIDRAVFGNDTVDWFRYKTRQHLRTGARMIQVPEFVPSEEAIDAGRMFDDPLALP